MADDQLLTVREVSEQLKVSTVTVQRWLRAGKLRGKRLPADKLGWRVPASEVQQFIADLPTGVSVAQETR